jgi:uncharacterized membrane protein
MRPFVLAATILSLAACSGEPETATEPAPAPEPAPVLGGVDLSRPVRLLGTEPFWGIDLTGTEIVYSGADRPEQRGPQPQPTIQGTVATLGTTTTAGTDIAITLTATECSDGMSDRTYPLTALVEVGEETLMGCAASTAAIMSVGESGPVVDQPTAQPAG